MQKTVSDRFVSFSHIPAIDKNITNKFLEQAIHFNLDSIFKEYKKYIHFSFHKSNEIDNLYLVMVVCKIDGVLVELARKYNFPRGFPIIWIPNESIQYYGFYPKFMNDDRPCIGSNSIEEINDFDNVTEVNFFKKWSGFLGQLIVFETNGSIYWTIASKNSADTTSKFVTDAKRIIEPFVTDALLEEMIEKKIHICGEVISMEDQVHGSKIVNESFIVTAIGKNNKYNLGSSHNVSPFTIVEFYSHNDLVDFCRKHCLHCDSAVTIKGKDNVSSFISKLSERRDFVTDSELQMILDSCNNVTIKEGTVRHCDILGNCLEGLVILLSYNNCSKIETIKYKFAPYTIRTMLYREVFEDFIFNHFLLEHIDRFVNHWCTSDKGREHWRKIAMQAFINYLDFVSPDKKIGDHIHIAEMTNKYSDDIEAEFNKRINEVVRGTVIICTGPIGHGKSSVCNVLCSLDGRFEHIDGDLLGLGMDKVMELGKERNDYTVWKVIETLANGKIPVISTGGGALFSIGKKQSFVLRKKNIQGAWHCCANYNSCAK